MTRTVTFYFGAASRYSYLAASHLQSISDATGAVFKWVPLDVPRLFKVRGASPFVPNMPAPSGQYEGAWRKLDCERWAEIYGIPFNEPVGRIAIDMTLLARACTVASELGVAEKYGHALMRRIFASEDEAGVAGCVAVGAKCGLDALEFTTLLNADSTIEKVDATVEAAHARGVFGAPTFVVDDQVFWGNDRLPLLQYYLASGA